METNSPLPEAGAAPAETNEAGPADSQPGSAEQIHPDLSDPQRLAIKALLEGCGYASAARVAGVHPATLFRWRTRDADFMVALNVARQEAWDAVGDLVLAARERAAVTVLGAIREGDVRASLAVLKGGGGLAPPPISQESAHVIRKKLDEEAAQLAKLKREERDPIEVSLESMKFVIGRLALDEKCKSAYWDAITLHQKFLESRAGNPPAVPPDAPPGVGKQIRVVAIHGMTPYTRAVDNQLDPNKHTPEEIERHNETNRRYEASEERRARIKMIYGRQPTFEEVYGEK